MLREVNQLQSCLKINGNNVYQRSAGLPHPTKRLGFRLLRDPVSWSMPGPCTDVVFGSQTSCVFVTVRSVVSKEFTAGRCYQRTAPNLQIY